MEHAYRFASATGDLAVLGVASCALAGLDGTQRLQVTPREVNRFVAFAAPNWIAGAADNVVRRVLADCSASQQ
jgi:hypothetical protein